MDSPQTLHDFVLNLLNDPEARSAFQLDPEGALHAAGLADVNAADVREVIPLVVDYAPVQNLPALTASLTELGTSALGSGPAGAIHQLQLVTQQLPPGQFASTDFTYSDEVDPTDVRNPVYTFLQAVLQTGYRRNNGGYDKRSLPPVEFEYTEPIVQEAVEEVDPESLDNLPIGLDGSVYRWTDLHGEGIPGFLTEQASAWFYKRNVSPISDRPVAFTPVERVPIQPNLALTGGQAQFMDLASDGIPDLVVMDGPMPGFYRHDDREGWEPFRSFRSHLSRETRDPNVRFIDVDGDGLIDVLITEDDAFVWYRSRAKDGFDPAVRVRQPRQELGPPSS